MLDLPYYWIGPLGALVPMACPEAGVVSELIMDGALQTALNGKNMMDVSSYRRQWSFAESWLDPDDFALLETLLATSHDQTLRIIDPLLPNRARLFASLTSDFVGYSQAKGAWSVTSGEPPTFPLGDWPEVVFTSQGDSRSVSYGGTRHAEWELSAAAILSVNGPVSSGAVSLSDVDAARAGEELTVSAWVRTSGAATVGIGLSGVDSAGTLTTTSSSAEAAGVLWSRISATYTVPAGSVGVFPEFYTTATSGTVYIAGIMINAGDTPIAFSRGGGSSEAIITELSFASTRFPLTNAQIALTEV